LHAYVVLLLNQLTSLTNPIYHLAKT